MSTYVPPHRRRAPARQPLGFYELVQLCLFATRPPAQAQSRNERRRATPKPMKFSARIMEEFRQRRALERMRPLVVRS